MGIILWREVFSTPPSPAYHGVSAQPSKRFAFRWKGTRWARGWDARVGMWTGMSAGVGSLRCVAWIMLPPRLLALAALFSHRREAFPRIPSLFVLGVDGRIQSSLPPSPFTLQRVCLGLGNLAKRM